jgi:hypothetical protein
MPCKCVLVCWWPCDNCNLNAMHAAHNTWVYSGTRSSRLLSECVHAPGGGLCARDAQRVLPRRAFATQYKCCQRTLNIIHLD